MSETQTSFEVRRVKPLGWVNRGGLWLSDGGMVQYRVSQPTNADVWRWATNQNGPFSDIYPTHDAAKAAAQTDYEQRILGAIEWV